MKEKQATLQFQLEFSLYSSLNRPTRALCVLGSFFTFPKHFMILEENSSDLLNGSVGGHESQSLCAGKREKNQTKPRNMRVDDGVTSSKQKPETIYMSNRARSSHKNKSYKSQSCQKNKYTNVIIVIWKSSAYG